jgi:hypothetical protein
MTSTAAGQKISYTDLYARWEKANWRATEIDFTEDREHWHERFSDLERRAALWNYAMFFHGEDSVTDNLSPYIDAAPLEEQKYFLATQQVDEARHAVFFGRFMREVVDRGDSIAGSLDSTAPQLTWGFRKVFARLDKMADELRKDRSRPKLAAAITLYHFIVEATLAQPGQHFIESYLDERGLMPGFRAGMANVSNDEQRHIGFGVKLLHDLVAEDPECKDAVAELLREVFPWSVAVFVPPNWDERYVTSFGFTLEEIFAEGAQSIEQKLRAAGLPPEELPGPDPLGTQLSPPERAELALILLRAGYLGEKVGPPSRDPAVIGELFGVIERGLADAEPNGGPRTIQWDFSDADPWFARVEDGATTVEQGRLESPEVTLKSRFEDFVDIFAGREDPRLAILKGKLRPRGKPLALLKLPKMLPTR